MSFSSDMSNLSNTPFAGVLSPHALEFRPAVPERFSFFNQMIQEYKKDIVQQTMKKKCWHLDWDMARTVFQRDAMALEFVSFHGHRAPDDPNVHVRIGYRVNHSFKICIMEHKTSSLEKAFLWAWAFLENHYLCKECGSLLENHAKCTSCLFFEGYMQSKGRKEVCAICQDPVVRYALPCGHMFHRLCLNRIPFSPDIRCPLCRADIPFDVICDLYDKTMGSDNANAYDSDDGSSSSDGSDS